MFLILIIVALLVYISVNPAGFFNAAMKVVCYPLIALTFIIDPTSAFKKDKDKS